MFRTSASLLLSTALLLSACGGGGGDSNGASTPPSTPTDGVGFPIQTAEVTEGAGVVTVALELPEALVQDLFVNLTLSGTASEPDDFTVSTLQVSIPTGSAQGTFEVTVFDDDVFEGDETVVLTIAGVTPAGAVDIDSQDTFTLTVKDDDPAPSVSFGSIGGSISEGDSLVIPVLLSEASEVEARVDVLRSGSASAADTMLDPETVVFAPGATTADLLLSAVADGLAEGDEQVVLTLANPTGATLGAESTASVLVEDSSTPQIGWGGVLFGKSSPDPDESGVFSTDFPPAVAQKITEDQLTNVFYTLSPDRDAIAYIGVEFFPPSSGVFLSDVDGVSIALTNGQLPADTTLLWSPDQSSIAFFARPGAGLEEQVFVAATNGSGAVQVSSDPIIDVVSNEDRLRWAPDSSRLAFTGGVDASSSHLFSSLPDGSGLVDLSGSLAPFASVQEEFEWSPDSAHIAFRSSSSLFTVAGSGGTPILISDRIADADDEFDFAWAPGTSRLVFRADDPVAGTQLFSCLPDGSSLVQVSTGVVAADGGWRISPDGSRVAYFGPDQPLTGSELRVAAIDGAFDLQVGGSLPDDQHVDRCVWSPDSTRVAYRQDELFQVDLLVAEADGSGFVSIAGTTGPDDFIPAIDFVWSPDGSRVAWIGLRVVQNPLTVEEELLSNSAAGDDKRVHLGPFDASTELSFINFKWTLDSTRLVIATVSPLSLADLRGVPVDGSAPAVVLPGTSGTFAALLLQYDVR